MVGGGYRQHLEQVDVPGLDAVSEHSQIGPMVGLCHPVEQPVVFDKDMLDWLWSCSRMGERRYARHVRHAQSPEAMNTGSRMVA